MLLAMALSLTSVASAQEDTSLVAQLDALYRQRDYFTLRERLAGLAEATARLPEVELLEAALQQAFNRPQASNQILDPLLTDESLSPALRLQAHVLRTTNCLRLYQYQAALSSARQVLASPAATSVPLVVREMRNKLVLLEALAEASPQMATVNGPSRLALDNTGRIPLTINGTKFAFALDTGANFSVIMRSEAEKLGLLIRSIGLVISTSTAREVVGDVTVADHLEIGEIEYRNVVFLVLPDEMLSFPTGQRIPGLIGFPLVEAMGEVRFRRDSVMEIPGRPPRRSLGNLALDDLDPLVRVRYRRDDLVCRLDTGASATVFYEPFYRRYQKRLESIGHPIRAEAAGVGGAQTIPAIRLPNLTLTIASAGVNLRRTEVYTAPIRRPDENYLHCNLGLDALRQFRAYSINFKDMALVLH